MLLRAVVIAALLGCGGEPEEAAPVEPPTETPAEAETEIEDEEEELEEEDDTPPSFTRAELDAMERPQLEEACYAGSQAACDRLGH